MNTATNSWGMSRATDWDGLDCDDLDAVRVWVSQRLAYLKTVLAAGPLPRV